jgi:phosphate transport system permease protein
MHIQKKHTKEKFFKALFGATAILTILEVASIIVFMLYGAVPALQKIGFLNFIFGSEWNSSNYDTYTGPMEGLYGIMPMIVGSLFATAGAVLVGGTIGFFSAVFLAEFCPKKLKKVLSHSINLLSGIPSVVYGFFGMKVLLPLLGVFSENGDGAGILSVSLVLGIMITPTVTALSKTSIEAVDRSFFEGAVALGARKERAVFKVIIPAGKSGIFASLILGIGRAIGETMAVVMVAGNNPIFPSGIFASFRTLTTNIVLEMSYGGELQTGALIASGAVLTFFILATNICFGLIRNSGSRFKGKKSSLATLATSYTSTDFTEATKAEGLLDLQTTDGELQNSQTFNNNFLVTSKKTDKASLIGKHMGTVSTIIACVSLFSIIIFILVNGLPYITSELLFGEFSYAGTPSIASSIVSTLMVIVLGSVVAFPLGIAAAIFLAEYANKNGKMCKIIRLMSETLGGIPSIVYGLFGLLFFCNILKMGTSILAGGLTLSLMIVSTTIRGTEEALLMVNDSLREASYALGAGKFRTIRKVVIPNALPGIFATIILGISRMVSESAPVLFTMGASIKPMPTGFKSSGATLAVALYALGREWMHINESYATACVLIILVLILNIASAMIASKFTKRLTCTT